MLKYQRKILNEEKKNEKNMIKENIGKREGLQIKKYFKKMMILIIQIKTIKNMKK